MNAPLRILVRGVNWLGDAVMTTPALQRLREALPSAHVALLTQAKLAELWTHHPDVDQVLTFDPGEGVWSVARHLRGLDFDVALVLPNSPRSALEVWLAGIPRRIGHAWPWRNLLLTDPVAPRRDAVKMHKRSAGEIQRLIRAESPRVASSVPPGAHHLHHYLNLAATLGASREPVVPRLAVTPAEIDEVKQRFEFPETRPVRLLGINAGAEYGPAKRWPCERFIAAAKVVRKQTGCAVWVFGGPADEALARGIVAEIGGGQEGGAGPVRCVAGETTLRQLCAALAACHVVLTNDTGPMHVAAAVGARVVVPFGSTSRQLTGPGLPGDPRHALLSAGVPCAPCFRRVCPIDFRCMASVPVEAVVDAVLKQMQAAQHGL